MWHIVVDISSNVSLVDPTMRWRWYLTDFTPASHNPPKCGAPGGLNLHSIPSFATEFEILLLKLFELISSTISFISLLAPTKFVPQSLNIFAGRPRLDTNRLRAARNASADKELTISRWMARVLQHTNIDKYAFINTLLRPCIGRTTKGPAKSTPKLRNDLAGFTRAAGRSPIICCWVWAVCLTHTWHFLSWNLIASRARTIQYVITMFSEYTQR